MTIVNTRVCERCERGAHRLCIDAECTCSGRGLRHVNRPGRNGQAPPRPASEGADPMTSTAPVVPIDKPKKTATPKTPPKFALQRVDDLPAKPTPKGLADHVLELLAGDELVAGAWYECITYSGPHGASSAVKRLTDDRRLHGYEFAARGSIVYVRHEPAAD